jgi:hypothetical protein
MDGAAASPAVASLSFQSCCFRDAVSAAQGFALQLRVEGGYALAFSATTAIGSITRLFKFEIARNPAGPLSTHCGKYPSVGEARSSLTPIAQSRKAFSMNRF